MYCAQRHIKFKEKPDAKRNEGSGDFRTGSHPTMLLTCEKELKKSSSSGGNHQQQKAGENVIE